MHTFLVRENISAEEFEQILEYINTPDEAIDEKKNFLSLSWNNKLK